MAGALASLGVARAIASPFSPITAWTICWPCSAAWRIGAIAALVNVQFAAELDYYFADHTPSIVIYTHDMAEPVRRAAKSVGRCAT